MPFYKKQNRHQNGAVGRFQNHNTNDPIAFGIACCITIDARPTAARQNNDANAPFTGLRCISHRVLWVLKDPNPHPCGFKTNDI